MRLLLLSLILAVTAHNALGYRRGGYFAHANIDMKRIMYAAGGTVQCDLCEMVVGDIQTLLSGQEDEIENLMDSLCEDLPEQWRKNCTELVDTYLPLLFTLIDDMTPAEVCELLTLCAGETSTPEITSRQSMSAILHHYMNSISRVRTLRDRRISYMRSLVGEEYLCEPCLDTVGYIHDAVACNQTWGEIARFLSPLCELCPSQYRYQCQNFFYELPGDVNEFADAYLDPETDCEIFGFCRGEEMVEEEVTTTPEPEEEEPVPEVRIPIEPRARIEVNMNDRMYDVSRYNKEKLKQAAKAARANKKAMRGMGIRGADRWMRKGRSISVQVAGQQGEPIPYDVYDNHGNRYETVPAHKKCEVCRYFSSAAEGVLQYNEEDITNGLSIVFQDICDALPEQFQNECESEIEDVVPGVIYQMVLKVMNPEYLCTEMIGICQ